MSGSAAAQREITNFVCRSVGNFQWRPTSEQQKQWDVSAKSCVKTVVVEHLQ